MMVALCRRVLFIALLGFCGVASAAQAQAPDPLPSWNEGPTKQSIVDFVTKVTTKGGPDYVAPQDRVAVFDNDGTLWIEQPLYTQFVFAIDQVKAMADKHPEWKNKEPFKSVLKGDPDVLASAGEAGAAQIMAVTHSGMSTVEFSKIVADWLKTAKHPRFKRPYSDLTYQPMLELLSHLRANDFKTFIVSGGGQEFMRAFTDKAYGIPPWQVVGSSGKTEYRVWDASPSLVKLPKVQFVNDGPGKPEGINRYIGRQPIFAFGNSDGDKEMLEWTANCEGLCFKGLVHHTDSIREYAYGAESHVGKFSNELLDHADAYGWTVVDMKKDWNVVFPSDKPRP